MNLKNMQITDCPKCKTPENVENKVLALDIGKESYFLEDYVVKDRSKYELSPLTKGYFVSALFCRGCEIGFIPDALTKELGIEKNNFRGRLGRNRPYGVGGIMSDDSYPSEQKNSE